MGILVSEMATLQNCIDQNSKSSEDLEINCDSKSVLKKLAPNGLLRFELDILAIHVGLRIAAANVTQIHIVFPCSSAKNTSAEK